METTSASEYLRRERVFGEYELERMVSNEYGESVPLTRLLEDYHQKKMQELTQLSKQSQPSAPSRRQWIEWPPAGNA
jgi:hypothetical protein